MSKRATALYLILDDADAKRVIAAWPHLRNPADPVEELRLLTGLYSSPAIAVRLKSLGLVFDDGTVDDAALQFVLSELSKAIEKNRCGSRSALCGSSKEIRNT